jgi:signal peptidase II
MALLPPDNFRSPAALARFILTMALGLGLDLWSKSAAFERLARWQPDGQLLSHEYPLLPGWLHFQVTTNRGAVFGLGQGNRELFVGVSIVAIVFLAYLFAHSRRQRLYQIVLGMLLAGVLGNLYDRIVFGYVRDMIHALPRWPNLFPWIFNVADVLLCCGVAALVLHGLFAGRVETRARRIQTAMKEG